MCIETTTSYRHCMAVRIHTFICLDHIDHTRLQIDNAPCPKLKTEVVISESARCCCRDHGYSCIRRLPGSMGDGGNSWSFMKSYVNFAKIESTAEKEARRLMALLNQIRVKKNELSFLKYSESQQAESASKRRKKNDKTPEQREGRHASEPPESSSQEVNISDMVVDDTAKASFSSAGTKERIKKSKAIRELEREIEDMTRRWIQEGGRELGSSLKTYSGEPKYDSEEEYRRRRRRESFDASRYDRLRPDCYRPERPTDRPSPKGRRPRRNGGFERGVTRDPASASVANFGRLKEEPIDDVEIKEEPVDGIKIKQEPVDDIEMDLTG